MGNEITEFFTAKKFRKGQKEALLEASKAFDEGFKYVILECPTGTGKSHIAATFAKYYNTAHILTVQKILQDQYARDFDFMYIMKGRSAYECQIPKKDGLKRNCAEGVCRLDRSVKHDDCSYKRAIGQAQSAAVTVHNFDSFYYQTRCNFFSKRDLLIIDEAHAQEEKFLNFVSFTISNRIIKGIKIFEYKTIKEYTSLLEDSLEYLEKRLNLIAEFSKLSLELVREEEELTSLRDRIESYLEKIETHEYVFEYVDHTLYQSVTFKPVYISDFIKNSLYKYGNKILFMSATILNKEIFCRSLGIDPKQAKMISTPSFFPKENRLMVKQYAGSMAYASINTTLPKVVKYITDILEDHPGDRGIIHTVSEKVAEYIKSNLKNKRLTFNKDYANVNDMLAVHAEKEGSVIVASGLREGLDLYGDLSRLQIIVKVPYLTLGDKRVKRRLELDHNWYGYAAVLAFVQSVGRSVRSEKDYAITYIIDSDFEKMYRMNNKFFPDYIKESITDFVTYVMHYRNKDIENA